MAQESSPAAPAPGSRLWKVLMAQYSAFQRDPPPNLFAWMSPRDIRVWYFLAVGLDRPYLGGEYIFQLTAPNTFPEKPPRFEFVTQNGLFLPGGPICISVGEWHADDKPNKDVKAPGGFGWRPSLGMEGFAVQVVNGMICPETLESGIRIQDLPASMKTLYAKMSRECNRTQHREVAAAFEELIAEAPESEPSLNARDGRLRLAGKPIPRRLPKAAPAPPPEPAAPAPPPEPAASAPPPEPAAPAPPPEPAAPAPESAAPAPPESAAPAPPEPARPESAPSSEPTRAPELAPAPEPVPPAPAPAPDAPPTLASGAAPARTAPEADSTELTSAASAADPAADARAADAAMDDLINSLLDDV